MEIRGQDYRVAVVVMMMEGEFAATKVMMASLRYSLRDERDVTISLLLNGGENEEINAYFTRTEGMIFYSSADNLGIAGGRNFLFTRPEVIGADIIMVLDNDLILPSDYVRRMCTSLVTARGAGIVGPVLVWGRSAKGFLDRRPKTGPKDESAATAPCFSSDDLKRYWVKEGVGDDLYYLGPRHWFLTDLMATPSSLEWVFLWLEKRLGLVKAPHFYLHNDPTVIAAIKCGVQRLHTTVVSGGVQVFFSSLLARVGLLEPAYSPYGHEDHEFSIRAERAGYRNYTTCDVFAVHGIDERHPMREHSWSKEVYARRRAISTRKVLRSPVVRILVLGEIVLHTVVTSAVSNLLSGDLTFPSVKSGIRGFIDGATTPLINTEKLIDRAEAAKRAAG